MPEISIITPIYADSPQKVAWLVEMLESVKTQTFTDWEVILIDDHSPQSLDEVKANYPSPKFRWLRTTRQAGPGLARNTAVALAESEGLLPVDADDVLPPAALEQMHQLWTRDRSKIVYGDLQRLEVAGERFEAGKVFSLPEYHFDNCLDPRGVIPVTALHSVECHIAAGGWKAELDHGLEDVEYWIAAGKAGFCGRHCQAVTLLYRRHNASRSFRLRRENRQETTMRNRIRELHSDVYQGRYPMGCCGHSAGSPSGGNNNLLGGGGGTRGLAPQMAAAPRSLDQYSASEKTWVEYSGVREASFGMAGQFTGIEYQVEGPGFKFEVHISDLPRFRRSGRGQDFLIGVKPPDDHEPVIAETNLPAPYRGPAPQLVEIFQLDEVAARAGR